MNVFGFIEQITRFGLEYFRVFPGLYRAQVTDNKDPEHRGRVRIFCPGVGHNEPLPEWVRPAFSGAGDQRGMFWPPEVGDAVFVSFRLGNAGKPEFYVGGWYGIIEKKPDVPTEMPYTNLKPQKRGFMTRGGHSIVFSDEPDNQYVRITWHRPASGDASLSDEKATADRASGDFAFMELTKDGSIQMSNRKGASLFLSADDENVMLLSQHGHSITMTESAINITDKDGKGVISIDGSAITILASGQDITVSGNTLNARTGGVFLGDPATFSAVLGETLLAWLSSHVHGTGVGPSTPPLTAAALPPILSKSVKLKL
jgi:hypothetical protein